MTRIVDRASAPVQSEHRLPTETAHLDGTIARGRDLRYLHRKRPKEPPAVNNPTIDVDADACPVKEEVVRVAERHGLPVAFVSNGGLRPSRDPMIRNIVVSKGADAADDWIVENAKANDVVITADIPLAARTVELNAHVIGPTGRPFTPETIGMAVAMRDLKQHLRETGESKGYNASFSSGDRSRFLSELDRICRRAINAAKDLK